MIPTSVAPTTAPADRPLPPVPSHFRLGEAEMPWSTDPWYRTDGPEHIDSSMAGIELEQRRTEDPQRRRELEDLHNAMMSVDTLDQDGWERWTWNEDSSRGPRRPPRSLGWAVSNTEEVPNLYAVDHLDRVGHVQHSLPPPYVVSQYENTIEFNPRRPRSAFA